MIMQKNLLSLGAHVPDGRGESTRHGNENDELVARAERVRSQLERERDESWVTHWREIAENIIPRRQRFLVTDRNRGDKVHDKIINSTATFALRTLSSGMMSGLTSPSRPWFRLTLGDQALANEPEVRLWLEQVESILRDIFAKSNIYKVLPQIYSDMGGYGTGAAMIIEDDEDVVRGFNWPIGSYSLGMNSERKIDRASRTLEMTARQIVQQWGIDNVSDSVATAAKAVGGASDEQPFEVCQVLMPNEDFQEGMMGLPGKKYVMVHYERGMSKTAGSITSNDPKHRLGVEGFHEFPLLAPRWEVTGNDVYGSSPAMDILGDVKAMQLYEKRSAQAIEKQVNPPMQGPPSLKNKFPSILPGKFTIVEGFGDRGGLRPAHEVSNFNVQWVEEKIRQHENRIKRALFEDMFLAILALDRREITAREVDERVQERLLMLGPVLTNLDDELLDMIIDRVFNIANRRGKIPEPPEAIQGKELKVEYLSILAQAQKRVDVGTIQDLAVFVAQAAQLDQGALDKFDFDEAVDIIAERLGVPVSVVRDDEAVAALREERAQLQEQAARQQQVAQSADVAKTLSETRTDEGNALNELLGAGSGALQ